MNGNDNYTHWNVNDDANNSHIFGIILTKTERDDWLGTIAHDLRFQQALRIRRTNFRSANVRQKISASKKR